MCKFIDNDKYFKDSYINIYIKKNPLLKDKRIIFLILLSIILIIFLIFLGIHNNNIHSNGMTITFRNNNNNNNNNNNATDKYYSLFLKNSTFFANFSFICFNYSNPLTYQNYINNLYNKTININMLYNSLHIFDNVDGNNTFEIKCIEIMNNYDYTLYSQIFIPNDFIIHSHNWIKVFYR